MDYCFIRLRLENKEKYYSKNSLEYINFSNFESQSILFKSAEDPSTFEKNNTGKEIHLKNTDKELEFRVTTWLLEWLYLNHFVLVSLDHLLVFNVKYSFMTIIQMPPFNHQLLIVNLILIMKI